MAKVLLIEDDTNLREIFAMRLQAEGYETLSAGDGEEGLVVAMKQKPDLIIADVMMPKLSGFEMLETLRATPEMRDIKVIMMTALGQAEDRTRGEKLGVVKYLVKSQVTLEDFVRVVRDVLKPGNKAEDSKANTDDKQVKTTNINQGSEKPMQDDQNATSGSQPAANPMGDSSAVPAENQMSTADEQAAVQSQVESFAASTPAAPADPAAPDAPADGSAMPAEPATPDAPAEPAESTPPADTPPAAPAA